MLTIHLVKMEKKQGERDVNYPSWNDSAERLILYADIMGFKERVYSKSHDELKSNLLKFKEKWEKYVSPFQFKEHLKFAQFSDSTLIVVNGTDEKMFNLLTKATFRLIHAAMEMKFPIKGVIAQGDFLFDKQKELYFGCPLVDAALLYDEIQYYGIVVHHSAERSVEKFRNKERPYLKSKIFLKSGKISHYHLCWNMLNHNLAPGDNSKECESWMDEIEKEVSGRPRIYVDNTRIVLGEDLEKSTEL